MSGRPDPVGDFIDACIERPDEARRLAAADPSLLHATRIGSPMLHWMVIEDFVRGAETLLDLGVPVDSIDEAGQTPLHHACMLGRLGCARLLLRRGADPNAYDDHLGNIPLGCAALTPHLDIIDLLLGAGARGDYVLPSTDNLFSRMARWADHEREPVLAELRRRGITRETVFAKLGGYGYENAEQAFGW